MSLSEKTVALSKYRLEQAGELLTSAMKNLEIGELKTANNRAYYCVFHAMRAVLALDEEDFKKHSGVIAYFREHYVKNAQIFLENIKSYLMRKYNEQTF